MWLFSKEISSSFNYTKTHEVTSVSNGWVLYNCTNKKGQEYSMFLNTNFSSTTLISLQNGLKRIKTLKHPDILNYVDSYETSKEIVIVTEKVIPLEVYLRERVDSGGGNLNFITSWGILQVVKALEFLEENCKLQHNFVCLNSVFVTRSGDWRLGLLDFVNELGSDSKVLVPPNSPIRPQDIIKVDSYGLGCFIWEVFNRRLTINENPLQSSMLSVPNSLRKLIERLCHRKGAMRPGMNSVKRQLEQKNSGAFCDNWYVQQMSFLEEIQVKDQQERRQFLQQLNKEEGGGLESFPGPVVRYKLLPAVLPAAGPSSIALSDGEMAETLAKLLGRASRLGLVPEEELSGPAAALLVGSTGRQARVALLGCLGEYVQLLPEPPALDRDVVPAVLGGLADTHPLVRESTVRACVHLAPRVSAACLHDTLLRSVCNVLIKDEQGGIRTNAAVLLAKIAPLLASGKLSTDKEQTSLSTVLLPGLLRATRDSFSPARRATTLALDAIIPLVSGDNKGVLLATKVLPCLSFLTVDSDNDVRKAAIGAMRAALDRLETMEPSVPSDSANDIKSSKANKSGQGLGWSDWLSMKLLSSTSGNIDSTSNSVSTDKSFGHDKSSTNATTTTTKTTTRNIKNDTVDDHKIDTNKGDNYINYDHKIDSDKDNYNMNDNHDDNDIRGWNIDEDDWMEPKPMKSQKQENYKIDRKGKQNFQEKIGSRRRQAKVKEESNDDLEEDWANADW